MLASFVVSLQPEAPAPLGVGTGAALRGLFYNLVGQSDAALVQHWHDAKGRKPFTVSPLRGQFQSGAQSKVALPGRNYWVRYTVFADDLFAALTSILLQKYIGRERVELGGHAFTVTDVEVEPREQREWGRLARLDELWQAATPSPQIALRFHSATAFADNGASMLFPLPASVFGALRAKWNLACAHSTEKVETIGERARAGDDQTAPAGGDPFGMWVAAQVLVESYHLETAHVPLGDYGLRGFIGTVHYTARERDPQRLKQLNALADFAFFCGTGQKTTQGMGQTSRADP